MCGIYIYIKYKLMKKFLIHDNGGRPFCVKILDEIDKQKVNIYKLNKKIGLTPNIKYKSYKNVYIKF